MLTNAYDLNVNPGGVELIVPVSQYDASSRQITFNLYADDGTLSLPSGVKAAVRGTKPDGNGFDYLATISGTAVTINITEQMTAVAGRVRCEIYLYKGTAATTESAASADYVQLATANFIIRVERAALDKDTLVSGSEIRQLVDVIDRTDEIIAAAEQSDEAKERIAELEASTQNAKAAALAAQNAAEVAQAAAEAAQAATEEAFENAEETIEDYKDSAMSDMQDDYTAKLAALQSDYEAKLAALQSSYTTKMSDMNSDYGSKMDTFQDDYEMKVAAIQADYEAKLAALQSSYDTKTSSMNSDYNTKMAALQEDYEAKLDELNDIKSSADASARTAVDLAQNANTASTQALEKATNAENESAETASALDRIQTEQQSQGLQLAAKVDGCFVENGVAYFTSGGEVLFEVTGIGGGGGGGDSGNNAVISIENTTGWMSTTISGTDACPVSFVWSSLENEQPTGNGSLKIQVSGVTKTTLEIPQGTINLDVSEYLSTGANTVSLTVSDIYGNTRTIRMTVTVVVLTLASTFDASTPYTGAISFPYTPTGNVTKTIHFIMDGVEIGTATTAVSGRQQSFTIEPQTHGSHVFEAYFEATINGKVVESNTLYYEIICIDPLSDEPIIVSNFNKTTAEQYETLLIDYTVYDPRNMEAAVVISVNDIEHSTLTVNRETHQFEYRAIAYGTLNIEIRCGATTKTFTLEVNESAVHPEAVTDQLSLYLSAAGRSNSEDHPDVWEYGTGAQKISATFTGLNWTRDGWQLDNDGQTCLRVMGGATVTIPVLVYGNDFVTAGKTIEIEFAAHDVMDYDATIISCMSGNRGFEIKADNAIFKSTRGDIGCRYTTDKHMRLTLAVEPRTANALMFLYIDGEYQGIKQYASTSGSFAQVDPVGITIGSSECAVDVYSIRVYDRYLTPEEVLGNFIADRQNAVEMIRLYRANDIFDDQGNIVISKLTTAMPTLPYGIFEGPESPQYKGDKKTIVFDLWDTASNVQRRLHAEGVQIDVQGTSSQYYAVKNYKIKYKQGCTVNGVLLMGFNIRDGEIAVNEFTLKADVASSESANNIVLEKLYNDLSKQLGILTPPQEENSAVRVGVDGFPCVFFWDFGDGPEFVGKYNHNNDKGTFDTFGFSEGDEAWDVRNNSSQLSKFHTTTLNADWYTEDYESIYPEEYSDSSRLLPMTEFIYSTWQSNATGDALETPITYGGVEYTHDTAAYRLAKFKAEFPDWYDLDNQAFYYVFTFVFLMVDSRQKNEHITYWHTLNKWWDLIWDCDTALGNDNRGNLTFEYWMEDTDVVESTGENVYNGADNVKWVNFRQAFWDEAKTMYQRMRSSGMFNADYLKALFHNWQAAWCKAIWNEDGIFKYVSSVRKNNDTQYLSMAYGSKAWQRDEFIDWRIPYCDSMFDVGDALLSIMFRPYYEVTEAQRAAGDVDIVVDIYKKSYVTVVWDSTKVTQRCVDSLSCQVRNPLSFASDSVCAIHNGKMIKDVHGMEKLYVGFWDSTNAPNLQALRLGSDATGYVNRATKTVSVGANRKLRLVDLRNCVNFGTDDQKTLDLAHCANIQKVYLDGTSAMGVELPNGGVLEEVHLPATTANIVLRNHPKLTDAKFIVESYENVDQLWLEGMTGLDTLSILESVPASTAVRITGFYWELDTLEEIDDLYDLLDTMRGLDINGQGQSEEVEKAQLSGTIHTTSITGDQIDAYQARYPYINITADHTTVTLEYYTWNGETLLSSETVVDGGDGTYTGTPTRTATDQYSYTFAGWALYTDAATANPDAVRGIVKNTKVYAAYTRTVQTYTVTFARRSEDGGGTLQTVTGVPYGGSAEYTGETPTTSRGSAEDLPFYGWDPAPENITGNTICYAVFNVVLAEIADSWADILAACEDGTYAGKYKVGMYKPLDLGDEGIINMQIVARDTDILASSVTGRAPLTWVGIELMTTQHRFNPPLEGSEGLYVEGTGMVGGYALSELKTWYDETVWMMIPEGVRAGIKEVLKTTYGAESDGTFATRTSPCKVWPMSSGEAGGRNMEGMDGMSVTYSAIYSGQAARCKTDPSGDRSNWQTRSASGMRAQYVYDGRGVEYNTSRPEYLKKNTLCFCT